LYKIKINKNMNNTQNKTVSIYFTQDELDCTKLSLNYFHYHASSTFNEKQFSEMSYVLSMIPVIYNTEITTEFNLDYYQLQGLITSLSFLSNMSSHAHIRNDAKLLSDKLFDFILNDQLTINHE
jgi:hypothetical protein